MPDLPASTLSHASPTPIPTGDTMPRPVMTTLRLANGIPCAGTYDLLESLLEMGLDVIDSLLHGRDFFCFFVGNLALELFFERHHQLDRVQRIGAEIVDKG